jgi:hypothetical protein
MFAPVILSKEELESPPSCTYGMLLSEEVDLRRQYELFLRTAGLYLRLSRPVVAVATTYFQIFASRMSLTLIDEPVVLCQAILYLAGKSEEEHRRLRDIMTVTHMIKHPGAKLLHLGEEHSALREHIVLTEQLVLRVLGFNLNVDLPHPHLYHMLNDLNASPALARLATACLNDLYPFSIVIEFKPQILATAALFFAIELSQTQKDQQAPEEEPLTIGGGETNVDPKSETLALDCVKALGIDIAVVLEIASRMMRFYDLPPITPFRFTPKN